jgi:hypothetical protein
MSTYTQAQIVAMHAAVVAEPTLAAAVAISNDPACADWLNSPSTFVVWILLLGQTIRHPLREQG